MTYRYPTVKIDGKTKLHHRHLAEQRIGRPLLPTEQVHHRNDDPFDRSDNNLVVIDADAHRRLHADKRLKYPREKTCSVCGAVFRPHPTKRKRQVTCSKLCADEQRSRSERATKAAVAAALVRANVTSIGATQRPRILHYLPLLEATE